VWSFTFQNVFTDLLTRQEVKYWGATPRQPPKVSKCYFKKWTEISRYCYQNIRFSNTISTLHYSLMSCDCAVISRPKYVSTRKEGFQTSINASNWSYWKRHWFINIPMREQLYGGTPRQLKPWWKNASFLKHNLMISNTSSLCISTIFDLGLFEFWVFCIFYSIQCFYITFFSFFFRLFNLQHPLNFTSI